MKSLLRALALVGCTLTARAADAQPDGVVIYLDHGRYRCEPPPHGEEDPVPPLGSEDAVALAKPISATWDRLVEGFAGRCAVTYLGTQSLPEGLAAVFKAKPAFARDFWLALDPRFDHYQAAIQVLEDLRVIDPKRFEQFSQLAIAMAVVWDAPDAVDSSRRYPVWGVEASQYPSRMDMRQVWDWYTDPKRQSQLFFNPAALPWPVLVNLVDLALSPEEATWAVQQFTKTASDPGPLYPLVPYDDGKLEGKPPKLGDRPYILANLRTYGGVCVDQTHFATEISKALGVPAVKCTGNGRYGGRGHAWTGYLIGRHGRPLLEFTGRYEGDFYYLGNVFDPQTRTMVLDRSVALLYDAVSRGLGSYNKARTLARIGTAIAGREPIFATKLAQQAIAANPFVPAGWQLYFAQASAGHADRSQAINYANRLVQELADHPDVSLRCMDAIGTLIPADKIDQRVALYEAAYSLYRQAKRPDLQILIRRRETKELGENKREIEALSKALETVQANAAEGALIMPLVEQVVEDTLRFQGTVKNFPVHLVREGLLKTAAKFPKQRGDVESPSWEQFQSLLAKLEPPAGRR